MVAYSFKPSFVAPIQAGEKRQTIRLPRKRHARPGEPLQLFTGMRTKACRKILDVDPICTGVDEVRLDLRLDDPELLVNGIPLVGVQRDRYALGDGFAVPARICGITPFAYMVRWWLLTHGRVLFTGVAIRWEPHDG